MKEHHAQGFEVKKSPGIVSLSQKSLLHVDLFDCEALGDENPSVVEDCQRYDGVTFRIV